MAAMTLLTAVAGFGGYDSSNDCTWVWRLQVWLMAMTVYGHHKPLEREEDKFIVCEWLSELWQSIIINVGGWRYSKMNQNFTERREII